MVAEVVELIDQVQTLLLVVMEDLVAVEVSEEMVEEQVVLEIHLQLLLLKETMEETLIIVMQYPFPLI